MSNFKTVQTIVIIGGSRFRFQETEKQLKTADKSIDGYLRLCYYTLRAANISSTTGIASGMLKTITRSAG